MFSNIVSILLCISVVSSIPIKEFNQLPGSTWIGQGVNALNFNIISQNAIGTFKGTAIEITYNSNCDYQHQVTYSGETYCYSDQISSVLLPSVTKEIAFSYNGTTSFDIQEQMEIIADGDALFGIFSASAFGSEEFNFAFKNNFQFNVKSYVSDNYIAQAVNSIELKPSKQCVHLLEKVNILNMYLPTCWISGGSCYEYFDQCGTHYVSTINTNVKFKYISVLDGTYVSAHGQAALEEEADANFLFLLHAQETGSASGSVDAAFNQSIQYHSIECDGGNGECNTDSADNFKDWILSGPSKPYLNDLRITPNYELYNGILQKHNRDKLKLLTEIHLAIGFVEFSLEILEAAEIYVSSMNTKVKNIIDNLPPNTEPNCFTGGTSESTDPYTTLPIILNNTNKFASLIDLHKTNRDNLMSRFNVSVNINKNNLMEDVKDYYNTLKELITTVYSFDWTEISYTFGHKINANTTIKESTFYFCTWRGIGSGGYSYNLCFDPGHEQIEHSFNYHTVNQDTCCHYGTEDLSLTRTAIISGPETTSTVFPYGACQFTTSDGTVINTCLSEGGNMHPTQMGWKPTCINFDSTLPSQAVQYSMYLPKNWLAPIAFNWE